jgi:hypothetical protein
VSGYGSGMHVKDVGYAGLVGTQGKLGERAAEWVGRRTRLDPELLVTIVGAVLFLSRTRRMLQMLSRLRARA